MGDGALEVLKWIALILMTGDHIDAALYERSVHWLYNVGRLAMPLFAACVAFNLARSGCADGRYRRVVFRLLVVGCIAQPFYMAGVSDSLTTLNILFAFALAIGMMKAWQAGWYWLLVLNALTAFLLTEYVGAATMLMFSMWLFFRPADAAYPVERRWSLVAVFGSMLLVCLVNGNLYALLALPLIGWVGQYTGPFPRWRNAFYVYYPAHLAVLGGWVWLVAYGWSPFF